VPRPRRHRLYSEIRAPDPIGNIYNWRCAAGTPTIVAQIETIDPRGFVARYWKPAEQEPDPKVCGIAAHGLDSRQRARGD